MKKNVLICILISFVAYSFAQSENSSENDAKINKIIEENGHVGIVAGYAVGDKIISQSAIGFEDRENEIKISNQTLLRTASIAKPMTAIAVMQLVEQGKISLDTPIQEYLPDYPKSKASVITTRMLLGHTSGIGGYKSSKESQSTIEYENFEEVTKVFADRELMFEPGTNFNYTSYGYVVLGLIIESASGMSYESYMQENIWDRAGMSNTHIERLYKEYPNKTALYHINRKKAKLETPNNLSNRIPAGGFLTTLEDLLKFGQAVYDFKLITKESTDQMSQAVFLQEEGNSYGFGWNLNGPVESPSDVLGHGGGQTGTDTQIFINVDKKLCSVAMSNTSGIRRVIALLALDLYKQGRSTIEE